MKKITSCIVYILLLSSIAFAQEKVNAREIMDKVNRGEAVVYQNVRIIGDLDFTQLSNRRLTNESKIGGLFNSGTSKTYVSTVSSPLTFRNCTFEDDVLAYYHVDSEEATYNASFEKDVVFEKCDFKGESTFKYSEFSRNVSFSQCHFSNEALFKYAKFARSPNFSQVYFDGYANFKYTEFPDKTNFAQTVFNGDADFKYAKFPQGASFQNTTFKRFANFKYTSFSEPLELNGVAFSGNEDFKYTKVDGKDFTRYLLQNK